VACTSAGDCAAGGDYTDGARAAQAFVATETGGTWGSAEEVPGLAALNTAGNASIASVACASAGNCSADGTYSTAEVNGVQGFVVNEKNGVWGKAKELPGLGALNQGGEANLTEMSCPSAGDCALGGSYNTSGGQTEGIVATEKNGTWGDAKPVPGLAKLNPGGNASVAQVSCASAGNCSAGGGYVDGSGHSQAFYADETNGTWGDAREIPGSAALNAGGGAYVTSVSCASAGNCAAIGNYTDSSGLGQVFVADETGGTWGDAEEIPGTAELNTGDAFASKVSCGAAGDCGATGWYQVTGGDDEAFVVSQTGGTWGDAEQVPGVATLGPDGSYGEVISCTSPGHCGAGGDYSPPGAVAPYVVSEK
jgi:hypothetical protein